MDLRSLISPSFLGGKLYAGYCAIKMFRTVWYLGWWWFPQEKIIFDFMSDTGGFSSSSYLNPPQLSLGKTLRHLSLQRQRIHQAWCLDFLSALAFVPWASKKTKYPHGTFHTGECPKGRDFLWQPPHAMFLPSPRTRLPSTSRHY